MTKKQGGQNRKGFQLVELTIVISTLSIVAAISIPAYQDFTARTRNDVTRAALAQFRAGIDRFETEQILRGTGNINAPTHPVEETMDAEQNPGGPWVIPNGDNPVNPWASRTTYITPDRSDWVDVWSMAQLPRGTIIVGNFGWIYNEATGEIWANSNVNGENQF